MFVLAIADRALDVIGLGTVIYWTVRGTLWISRRMLSHR